MFDCLYVIYNKLSQRYENVLSFPTDAVLIHHLKNGKFKIDTYEVCKIGEIDILTGIATTTAPVRIDLSSLNEIGEELQLSEN